MGEAADAGPDNGDIEGFWHQRSRPAEQGGRYFGEDAHHSQLMAKFKASPVSKLRGVLGDAVMILDQSNRKIYLEGYPW